MNITGVSPYTYLLVMTMAIVYLVVALLLPWYLAMPITLVIMLTVYAVLYLRGRSKWN